MKTKICYKCKVEKSLDEFYKRKASKDGHQSSCKCCRKAYNQAYHQANREKIAAHRQANREKIAAKKKAYYQANRDEILARNTAYKQERKANDPLYKFTCSTQIAINQGMKRGGSRKTSKTVQILGCTFDDFIVHIAMQFENGMSLANHGDWHLDHIVPVSWATNHEEAVWLNHYSNFQPLWAEDNWRKNAN